MLSGVLPTLRAQIRRALAWNRGRALRRQWTAYERSTAFDRRVPAPSINYNQRTATSVQDYLEVFKSQSCLKELPFLIREFSLKPSSKVFDYGCGLGRLAYAFSNYLSPDGRYVGYEVNERSRAFLNGAYAGDGRLDFLGDALALEEDYIAVSQQRERREGMHVRHVTFPQRLQQTFDLQWSCSVFTHMWKDAITHILREINRIMAPAGMCVNTWLIVDDFAAYVLKCGLADLQLPYRINGAWTYSETNPLVCTAWSLEDVKEMYVAAQQEIIAIHPGSWTGRDNGVLSQDIVISRPRVVS